MYSEEFLPDDAVFDEDMDISIETSTVDSEKIERKKIQELYRLSDPEYYYFKRYEESPDGSLKPTRVRIFASSLYGYIRNAPTGLREEHRVGSKYEDLYFSVKDTVYKSGTTMGFLYYRNPEEFERHFKIEVSKSIKEKWNEKYLRAKSRLL